MHMTMKIESTGFAAGKYVYAYTPSLMIQIRAVGYCLRPLFEPQWKATRRLFLQQPLKVGYSLVNCRVRRGTGAVVQAVDGQEQTR